MGAVVRQVRDVRPGDHLYSAFSHESEQREVVTAFVGDGLESGERVLYLTDDPAGERVRRWLGSAGIDTAAATRTGRLTLRSAEDGYLPSGRFDVDATIAMLRREVDSCLAAGFTGFRVSGEMGWALRGAPGTELLDTYERRVTALFDEGLSAAICQYDTRLFPSGRLDALVGCHHDGVQANALFHDGRLRITPGSAPSGAPLLRVAGIVDQDNIAALRTALEALLRDGPDDDVRLDMADLEFIDVAGLRDLASTAALLPRGRHLRMLNLAPMLGEVVRLVGWDRTPGLILDPEVVPA
ncbi:MEDS domain-containing protein [Streptosporangium sp. NPDC050855]|uniref:MEDS domain-containing protein n=1 Tax=Streptosporangium sp. NPDC050855 TaxID=3366194 RepID=UPI003791FB51